MTSDQLMQQAKELERQERLAEEDKDLKKIKELYEGKCFATSKFRQKSKATSHDAIYIYKIERLLEHKHATAAGTIVCYYQQISLFKDVDWRTEKHSNIRYSCGNYTTHLNNDRGIFINMYSLIDRKKEIPYSTFYELYNAGEVSNLLIEDAFNGKIQLEVEKTIGDDNNQSRFEESCKIANIELIDLEKHLPLLSIIRYAKLPGYVEDRFLMKILAKTALETKIKLNNKEINNVWCDHRERERYEKEIEVLQKYISKLNL